MAGGSAPRRKGDAFERKVRAELEAKGWTVVRSGGSLSPIDLVAIPHPRDTSTLPLLVQCKLAGKITRRLAAQLVELSGHTTTPVLATRDGYYRLPTMERIEL